MPPIRVGCAGYSYEDWVGPFYPQSSVKGDRLSEYARHFSLVELNFSYYAMPRREQLGAMAEKVPAEFLFVIKAHGSLTHERTADWEARATEFSSAITGLGEKLGGVLLQFPFSFHYTRENRRYLAALTEELRNRCSGAGAKGAELFVEFRNREWERPSVLEGMARRRLHRVLVDAPTLPELPHSINGTEALPTNLLYLRLHGRNRENWWSGTNVTRYAYNYSAPELREISDRLDRLSAAELFVIFNNHANARAPLNALELLKLVEVE